MRPPDRGSGRTVDGRAISAGSVVAECEEVDGSGVPPQGGAVTQQRPTASDPGFSADSPAGAVARAAGVAGSFRPTSMRRGGLGAQQQSAPHSVPQAH